MPKNYQNRSDGVSQYIVTWGLAQLRILGFSQLFIIYFTGTDLKLIDGLTDLQSTQILIPNVFCFLACIG